MQDKTHHHGTWSNTKNTKSTKNLIWSQSLACYSEWVEALLKTLGAVHVCDQQERSAYAEAVRSSRLKDGTKRPDAQAVLKIFQAWR